MKSTFAAISSIAVAIMFLIPPTVIAEGWGSGSEIPAVYEDGGSISQITFEEETPSSAETINEVVEESEILNDGTKDYPATFGPDTTNPDTPEPPALPDDGTKPGGWPEGVPKPIETKSAVMTISKFTLLHENKEIAESLDDGEDGFIAVDITNEGRSEDIMTDVEVDFYYVDSDGRDHYINRYVIDTIEGNGESKTAIVSWDASMLAEKIRIIADQDGSDGGPSERIEDITVNPAEYFQVLKVPYNRGSGVPGNSAEFDIKVLNVGTNTDTVELRFTGEGNWNAEFEGGSSRKTLSDM